jgi:hypothetical protein
MDRATRIQRTANHFLIVLFNSLPHLSRINQVSEVVHFYSFSNAFIVEKVKQPEVLNPMPLEKAIPETFLSSLAF